MDEEFQAVAFAPWDYEHESPFLVLSGSSGELLSRHRFENIGEAMKWFVRFQLGPLPDRSASVVDNYFQILVGYLCYTDVFEVTQWFGTRLGFSELSNHYDSMMVALWEAEAQARCSIAKGSE